jgi:type IVB pilus formation R64 PilN family outer membrane protein
VIAVAKPDAKKSIAEYIEQSNRRFARNVLIDVRVLEFQTNDGAQIGLKADTLIEKVFRSGPLRDLNINIDGADISTVTTGTPSTVTIGAESRANRLTLETVIQALDSVSKVSLKNQGQIVAINGQPAPFQQANQITYLASTTTSVTNNTVQVSRTPATITVGFTANFIPTVLTDNRILLQYQIQSSSLLGLKTIGGADNSIQLPEVFSQNMQQQAYLKDGDVIALFSFDQDRSQVSDTSAVLSKSRSATSNSVKTAVLIQVRVAK